MVFHWHFSKKDCRQEKGTCCLSKLSSACKNKQNVLFIFNPFQHYSVMTFSMVLWLVAALLLLFWCAAWVCCWSLSKNSRKVSCSAEEDQRLALTHSASAYGVHHFIFQIGYITVFLGCPGLRSMWLMAILYVRALLRSVVANCALPVITPTPSSQS